MSQSRSGRQGSVGLALLPGAGLGSEVWADLAPLLTVPVLAVDYPGRDDSVPTGPAPSLADYVASVRKQLDGWPADRVVLVAHSLGGVIALKVAQELPDRVAGFVAVSAAIPADGGSFVSAMPFPRRLILGLVLRLAGTRPPAAAIRQGLCSDLTADQADQVVSRFTPESRAVYVERTDAPAPDVPRLYVKLTEDREFPPALQARMAQNLGAGQVVTIDSGHLPMLSRPDELARVLNDFAATVG